jgi:hypothetical protein
LPIGNYNTILTMAGRPQKQGLDYFSFDTGTPRDRKIQILESKHPIEGWYVWTKLLLKIYEHHGYFWECSEENLILFSRDISVDENRINVIINSCIKFGLFDRTLFEKFRILTSNSIQSRYLYAVYRRQVIEIIDAFWLAPELKKAGNLVFLKYDDINRIFENNNVISDYKKYASERISFKFKFKYNREIDIEESNYSKRDDNKKGDSVENSKKIPENLEINNSELTPVEPTAPKYPLDVVLTASQRPKVFDWEWEKTYFQQNSKWIFNIARNYGHTEDYVRSWFPAFFQRLENTGGEKSADKMWHHFANWFPKRLEYQEAQEKKNKNADINDAHKKPSSDKNYNVDNW